jgi:hypothetical protein
MSSQVILTENASTPSAPPANQVSLYAKIDGNIYSKNSANVETLVTIGAGITDLTGDVTATGPGSAAASVVTVGGSSASNVHSAEQAANAATNLNTPSTIVKRDASGNCNATNFISALTTVISSGGTVTLTTASTRFQTLTGSLNETFILPNATTLPVGYNFEFNNNSTGTLIINDSVGNPVLNLVAGGYARLMLVDNLSIAGSWDKHFLLPALASSGNSGTTIPGSLTTTDAIYCPSDVYLTNANFNSTAVGNTIAHVRSTGIQSGGILSINGSNNTKFDLSAGTGIIVNYTNPLVPTITPVSWNAYTAQTDNYLTTADYTYILIDNTGSIVQLNTIPTPDQRRQYIYIGRNSHSSRVSLGACNSFPDYSQSPGSQLYDALDALGPFNISGNVIATNGANLTLQRSAGKLFFRTYNYPVNIQNPNIVSTNSAAPVSMFYLTQTGGPQPVTTNIDPTNYDNAGTITTVPANGNATIQRLFLFPNGLTRIQYGQTVYSNFGNALAALFYDPFIENPSQVGVSILLAYIIVTKNCTDLTNTSTALLVNAKKFAL